MATFSYGTLLPVSGSVDRALSSYAKHFGVWQRRLFALIAPKKVQVEPQLEASKLKKDFCREYGSTARQFNAVRFLVEGMIASVQKHREGLIKETKARIVKAKAVVEKLRTPTTPKGRQRSRFRSRKNPKGEPRHQKKVRLAKLHQKRRRLAALERKLASMEADHEKGRVRIAFGSRKLFHKQFNEYAPFNPDGYQSHADWYRDWEKARSSQFFVLGSKGETAGCQGCVATINKDESLDLRVRLPDAVAKDASIQADASIADKRYVVLKGVRFAHGHEELLQALLSSKLIAVDGKRNKRDGVAISWRLIRELKHEEPVWSVHVTVDVTAPPIITRRENGVLAADFNADHLAQAELDRSGNPVDFGRIPTNVRYKSSGQQDAIFGDAAKKLVDKAAAARKPIVIEKLDFSKAKAQLEDVDPRRAKMLSSLAYSKFNRFIKAAAFRAGIEVLEVDAAYTSVIGAINYAQILGISVHIAAAIVIARRGMNMTEKLRPSVLRKGACVPVHSGGHVTFSLLDDSENHVCPPSWGEVTGKLRAARLAHYRSGRWKNDPAPLSPRRAAGAGSCKDDPAPPPPHRVAAGATW